MKKMLTILACLMIAVAAFGQWETVKGPNDLSNPSDAVALDATTMLKILDNVVSKTTDFGATWTEAALPDDVNLTAIDAVGSTLYACADAGYVYKSVDAGDTWTQVGDTAQFTINMDHIDVLDADHVYIVGGEGTSSTGYTGWFFKTENGGTTWDTITIAGEIFDGGVAFNDASNGIIFDDGLSGIIYTTHDGGATWTDHAMVPPFTVSSKRMYACAAAGNNTYYVGAYYNMIYKSTDNGDTWSYITEQSWDTERVIKMQAFDENTMMALTSMSNILTTADGGTTWDTLNTGCAQSGQTMAFSSLTNGLVWGSYGADYSTVDGSTFVPLNEWPGMPFYSLTIPSEDKLIVGANYGGEITVSEDGGATWSYPTNAATSAKSSIYISLSIDENTVLIGGSAGYIAKSVDGGETWTVIDNPMAQMSNKHVYMLYLAPNGDVYAGGSSGNLMVSTDTGDTWTEVENEATGTVYGMCVFSNGMAMLGQSGGYFSVSTSTVLDSFATVADYGSMNFRTIKEIDGKVLIIGGDNIYTTTIDKLDTLELLFDSPTGDNLYGFEFVNDTVAFVAGDDGAIFRTDDAGLTWEQEYSEAYDYIYDLKFDGEKLWAVGKFALIMSREVNFPQADFVEEFADGDADLTWVENTANANTGGLNLTVVADSAGLTNVGVYVNDAGQGLLYADTGEKLRNYEVSADIYIVKEPSATEALYKGLTVKTDPAVTKFYRFVYRNSSSSDNGQLRLQGYDGAGYETLKYFNPGVDFDTLETGFHNFKVQVIDDKFWAYIDDVMLPGCPYLSTTTGLKNGYPGVYSWAGTTEFDNFKVSVYDYAKYQVNAHVNMSVQMLKGNFVDAGNLLDIMGSFNGWTEGIKMTDADGDSIYSATLGEFDDGTVLEFKCRRDGTWTGDTHEYAGTSNNRSYTVLAEEDQDIPVFYYDDVTEVAIDGIPAEFALEQNYPNPFNPATTLKFQIPNSEMVNISIYDVAGRKVAEVVNTQLDAGYYSISFDASVLPSGVYLYRIMAGEYANVRKMTLLK